MVHNDYPQPSPSIVTSFVKSRILPLILADTGSGAQEDKLHMSTSDSSAINQRKVFNAIARKCQTSVSM